MPSPSRALSRRLTPPVLTHLHRREDVWDQSAYNMEIFRPAYGSLASPGVTVRPMDMITQAPPLRCPLHLLASPPPPHHALLTSPPPPPPPPRQVRSMNYLCFCNTKLLFKYMRYDAQLIDLAQHRPVTVHINYHPEKEQRMVSVNK